MRYRLIAHDLERGSTSTLETDLLDRLAVRVKDYLEAGFERLEIIDTLRAPAQPEVKP